MIGNTANEASRIQDLASPDTVMISNDTWLLVKDKFEFIEHGETMLKGRDHPVRLYEVRHLKGAADDQRIKQESDGFQLRVDPQVIEDKADVIAALEEAINCSGQNDQPRTGLKLSRVISSRRS